MLIISSGRLSSFVLELSLLFYRLEGERVRITECCAGEGGAVGGCGVETELELQFEEDNVDLRYGVSGGTAHAGVCALFGCAGGQEGRGG